MEDLLRVLQVRQMKQEMQRNEAELKRLIEREFKSYLFLRVHFL